MTITELGCAGHFICAKDCLFRRHTQIGDSYRVSTVGNFYYKDGPRKTLGGAPDSFFETYVFRTSPALVDDNEGCGCHEVAEWSEIEGIRSATAGAAHAGHEAMVAKYAELETGLMSRPGGPGAGRTPPDHPGATVQEGE